MRVGLRNFGTHTSTVAQQYTTHPPPVPARTSDRSHDVQPDETLSWMPGMVLAQPPSSEASDFGALVALAKDVLTGCAAADAKSWDKLMRALLQNGTLQPFGTPVDHADMLVRKTASFSVNEGSHLRTLQEEIDEWLKGLVAADPSLFDHTVYTMDALAAHLVQDSTPTLLIGHMHKMKGRHEGKVDVPIFRLPDAAHPFLTVYRIQIDVWSSKQRAFVVRQNDELVLSGQYNVRYFKLRGQSM